MLIDAHPNPQRFLLTCRAASQILLNNLLYDTSQLAIPTDTVDPELVAQPTRWDIGFIRRFMIIFGPISSIFDFTTFGIMRWVFHAGPALFQTGWFVESLATQTLVIFVIRRRGYRVHRRAGRFAARTLRPAGSPIVTRQTVSCLRRPAQPALRADAPGAPLDGKHGTSAPSA